MFSLKFDSLVKWPPLKCPVPLTQTHSTDKEMMSCPDIILIPCPHNSVVSVIRVCFVFGCHGYLFIENTYRLANVLWSNSEGNWPLGVEVKPLFA